MVSMKCQFDDFLLMIYISEVQTHPCQVFYELGNTKVICHGSTPYYVYTIRSCISIPYRLSRNMQGEVRWATYLPLLNLYLNLHAKAHTCFFIRLLIGAEAISICSACGREELCEQLHRQCRQ